MNKLTWGQTQPGLWRSLCGAYAIVRAELPERRPHPTVTYTLRKIGPASAAARPGTLGFFLAERYGLGDAQGEAERDAYCAAHAAERNIPEDFPAVALERFFWPVSNGTSLAALAVCRDGARLTARVTGMARGEDRFEPVTYAEIDLTALAGDPAPAATVFGARRKRRISWLAPAFSANGGDGDQAR